MIGQPGSEFALELASELAFECTYEPGLGGTSGFAFGVVGVSTPEATFGPPYSSP